MYDNPISPKGMGINLYIKAAIEPVIFFLNSLRNCLSSEDVIIFGLDGFLTRLKILNTVLQYDHSF